LRQPYSSPTHTQNRSTHSPTSINTVDGGTHLTGLRSALTRVVNDYARKNGLLKDSDPNFSGDDTREGLTAIVSVKHPDPQFESQTKVKLMNAEVQTYVQQIVGESFATFLDENPRLHGPSSPSASLQPGHATRRAKPAISSFASRPSSLSPCRASWPTVPREIPQRPNCILLRVIRQAAPPSRAVTGISRPFCLCAAKS